MLSNTDPPDAEALLRAAAGDQNSDVWLFTLFGLNATMRHSKILRRRFDEVDWENCRVWMDRAKAGARAQPITPALRDALRRHREGAPDQDG